MKFFKAIYAIAVLSLLSFSINAQDLSLGADFVNRYIWRGLEINDSPNIQPALSLGYKGLEVGLWGSYTLSNEVSETDEIDAYVGYTINSEAGDISLLLTDYYFPNAGVELSDFDGDGGAHTLEAALGFSPASFPISFLVAYNIHNDDGNNIYFELGYSATISDVEFGLFAAAAAGSEENPGYYGTEDFSFINIGLSASKSIKITEDFELPISSSFIVNPNADIAYLVFGFSL